MLYILSDKSAYLGVGHNNEDHWHGLINPHSLIKLIIQQKRGRANEKEVYKNKKKITIFFNKSKFRNK